MNKIKYLLVILLLFPLVVFADEPDYTTTTQVPTTINENPDTGVDDYFLTLTIASVILIGTLTYVNKKNVFKKI